FTYNGVTYVPTSNKQQAVAVGDHFLSVIIPQIEATPEYQNNGAIIIWFDETEGGDSTDYTMPEIVISPLAKGNAYASAVPLNHSSDVKTMQEIFGLGSTFLNNPIPIDQVSDSGGYNTVASVSNLGDLFQSGTLPLRGDMNGDGRINVTDLSEMMI